MKSGMLKNISTFGGMTMLSRVLGLVRDVVVAAVFGSSAATDAFLVAFKIPNFMRRLFAEGAFAQAFVPVLSEYKVQRDQSDVRLLVAHVSGSLGSFLLLLTLLGIVGAPMLTAVFAPGWASDDPAKYALATDMLRLTFPYLLLISLTACLGAVLNSYGRFGPPAFAPVLLNICLIAGAFWAWPHVAGAAATPGWLPEWQIGGIDQPIEALAWAVLVAGVLQLLMQMPFVARLGLLTWPRWGWRDPAVKRIILLMAPILFSASVYQINMLVDTALASFLVTGSIAWLYWANRMVEFPLGIFGVALGTVILPRLSQEHAGQTTSAFNATLDWALRLVLLISVPAALGLTMLAVPIIATLFQRGSFVGQDTLAASLALGAYAVLLVGLMMVKILLPGYFSRQDTRTPMKYAVITMLANMGFSVVAVLLLFGTPVAHVGLAMATGLGQSLNAVLLYRGLRSAGVYTPRQGWRRHRRQVGLAALLMVAVLYYPASQPGWWLEASMLQRAGGLTLCVVLGAVAYGLGLWLTRFPWRSLRGPETVADA